MSPDLSGMSSGFFAIHGCIFSAIFLGIRSCIFAAFFLGIHGGIFSAIINHSTAIQDAALSGSFFAGIFGTGLSAIIAAIIAAAFAAISDAISDVTIAIFAAICGVLFKAFLGITHGSDLRRGLFSISDSVIDILIGTSFGGCPGSSGTTPWTFFVPSCFLTSIAIASILSAMPSSTPGYSLEQGFPSCITRMKGPQSTLGREKFSPREASVISL
ncbi:MAG: hypothetical protein LBT40_13050 [Deltaproteobacteria bacterium]|nr:hypothetical protein [Deltaproteobacteria bacterium]